jgi:hypothetical protein
LRRSRRAGNRLCCGRALNSAPLYGESSGRCHCEGCESERRMSGSSIGGIGNDKERQRRDKPSRKASCRVEWGEVQQDLLGERQKQVEACRRMAERMSEQDAREGQEESRVLIDTDTVSLCGLKIDNNCPQALIRPRARSDDPGRRELPKPD